MLHATFDKGGFNCYFCKKNKTMIQQAPVTVYSESTPNPNSMKFVLNRMLTNDILDFPDSASASVSPLVSRLFEFSFVRSAFVSANFITLTKDPETEWHEVTGMVRECIKSELDAGTQLLAVSMSASPSQPLGEVEEKIVSVLEEYIRPAVEMDGGAIQFRSFDGGIVTVSLQGACSGCPSSTLTLKAGIENLLKRMVPEVTEVVAMAE
jgi:Fe-S cluster biogenesis protein NfuA